MNHYGIVVQRKGTSNKFTLLRELYNPPIQSIATWRGNACSAMIIHRFPRSSSPSAHTAKHAKARPLWLLVYTLSLYHCHSHSRSIANNTNSFLKLLHRAFPGPSPVRFYAKEYAPFHSHPLVCLFPRPLARAFLEPMQRCDARMIGNPTRRLVSFLFLIGLRGRGKSIGRICLSVAS